MKAHLLLCSLLALSAAGCFDASAEVRNTEPGTAFASAVLPAAGAWSNGSEINCGGSEWSYVYLTYTTHASSTTGNGEFRVALSHDSVTWYPYGVCDDAAASQSGPTNLLDEWECTLYERVWNHDTPGAGSKTQQLPPLSVRMQGAQYIRVSAREKTDPTNRGTVAGVVSCGMERR